MRSVVLLTVFFLWVSAAVLAQQKASGSAPQNAKPAASAQPAQQKPAAAAPKPAVHPPAAAAKPAAPAPKPAAAAASKPKEQAKPDPQVEAAMQALKEKQVAEAKRKRAADLVHEYFKRWNTLDGTDESVNKFVELYNPDATHEVGPGERQIGGPVYYEGQRLIRRMAQDFGKTWTDVTMVSAVRTLEEKTTEIFHVAETPWGSLDVAMEFMGGQTNRETKKRYVVRGAAFFEMDNEGKLTKVRIYLPKDEISEISGPFSLGM